MDTICGAFCVSTSGGKGSAWPCRDSSASLPDPAKAPVERVSSALSVDDPEPSWVAVPCDSPGARGLSPLSSTAGYFSKPSVVGRSPWEASFFTVTPSKNTELVSSCTGAPFAGSVGRTAAAPS